MRPLIVGVGGTSRAGSTSEKALRWVMSVCEGKGAATTLVHGRMLDLPNYDPGDPHRAPAARRLVDLLRAADGIVISTPSYHGGPSGMIKNALDYTEDLAKDARPYLDGRAVGLIVAAYGPQAMGTTLTSMRSVIHALRGWPTPAAAAINGLTAGFGPDGTPAEEVAAQLTLVAGQVMEFAQYRMARDADRHGDAPATRI